MIARNHVVNTLYVCTGPIGKKETAAAVSVCFSKIVPDWKLSLVTHVFLGKGGAPQRVVIKIVQVFVC